MLVVVVCCCSQIEKQPIACCDVLLCCILLIHYDSWEKTTTATNANELPKLLQFIESVFSRARYILFANVLQSVSEELCTRRWS